MTGMRRILIREDLMLNVFSMSGKNELSSYAVFGVPIKGDAFSVPVHLYPARVAFSASAHEHELIDELTPSFVFQKPPAFLSSKDNNIIEAIIPSYSRAVAANEDIVKVGGGIIPVVGKNLSIVTVVRSSSEDTLEVGLTAGAHYFNDYYKENPSILDVAKTSLLENMNKIYTKLNAYPKDVLNVLFTLDKNNKPAIFSGEDYRAQFYKNMVALKEYNK